ncbi:MAG: class I SAM-dependent rRNA methyltransferase [Polyangiales bacterium]
MPDTQVPTLVLAQSRERSLLRRHPWVFSGAVRELQGHAELGDTVRVCASDGRFLAWAAYNPGARIAARVWDFDPDARIDAAFFARKLATAIALRDSLLPAEDLRACRLVHAESDGLPGLVVDRLGDQLVLQATSAGAARHRELIATALVESTGLRSMYERSEGEIMQLEGLPARSGVLRGDEPDAELEITEHGLRYAIDVREGHKTGFYLDQRENRALIRHLARDRDVLDCFCYGGGFALNAARGGARSVHAIDSSEQALGLARHNAQRNDLGDRAPSFERADVFEWLRTARDSRRSFDLIVLDPPKLAPTARLAERAARAYKDLSLLAFKLLRPGGLLLTFSCSSGVSRELFQKIVAGAAADARVDAAFVRHLSAGPDHPVGLAFPEGEYLKGLLCRVP